MALMGLQGFIVPIKGDTIYVYNCIPSHLSPLHVSKFVYDVSRPAFHRDERYSGMRKENEKKYGSNEILKPALTMAHSIFTHHTHGPSIAFPTLW